MGLKAKQYVVLAACIALLAVTSAAYHFWLRPKNPSSQAKITQISQWDKPMNSAKLSPDGDAITCDVDGEYQLGT